jgi:hypothetical protein
LPLHFVVLGQFESHRNLMLSRLQSFLPYVRSSTTAESFPRAAATILQPYHLEKGFRHSSQKACRRENFRTGGYSCALRAAPRTRGICSVFDAVD